MKKKIALGIVIFLLVLTGCAKEQIYSSSPPMKTVSNDLYEAKLEPLKAERYNYYNSFRFMFRVPELFNSTKDQLVLSYNNKQLDS